MGARAPAAPILPQLIDEAETPARRFGFGPLRVLTTHALGFMLRHGNRAGAGLEFKVFPKDHEPVHAHVEFDRGVLLIAFIDGNVVPLDVRGTVRAPDIKKALIVAEIAYDEILAEWERMQQ